MALVNKSFSDIISFTRASSGGRFNASGVYEVLPVNQIRNNTMQGAVAGSPGTFPTNWAIGGVSGTLVAEVVSLRSEGGLQVLRVRFSGTPSVTTSSAGISFEPTNYIVASSGQVWTNSFYHRIEGTPIGVSNWRSRVREGASGGSFIASHEAAFTPTSGSILEQRRSNTTPPLSASAAFVTGTVYFAVNSGVPVDVTFDIAAPQLELGALATAAVQTSGTATAAPQLDFDPVTLQPRGLGIWEQRTNLVANPHFVGAAVGAPGTAPTGHAFYTTTTGISRAIVGSGKIKGVPYLDFRLWGTSTAGTAYLFIFNPVTGVSVGDAYTFSARAGIVGGSYQGISSIRYVIDEKTSGLAYVTSSTGGNLLGTPINEFPEYLVTHTVTAGAPGGSLTPFIRLEVVVGQPVDVTIRVMGLQFEKGAFKTPLILPPDGVIAQATRAADSALINTLSPWYNQTEGTLFAKYKHFSTATFPVVVGFSNLSISDCMNIISSSTTGNRSAAAAGGVAQVDISSGNYSLRSTAKAAFAYRQNDYAFSVNGSLAGVDLSALVPSVSAMQMGVQTGGLDRLNGWIEEIRYFPRRLSNAELRALTA